MSIELTVKIVGADRLKARLQGMIGRCPKALDSLVKDLGDLGYEYEWNWCPVRTGNLQSTIEHVHTWMHSVISAGGPRAPYGIFVERGTRFMANRAFVRPAADAIVDQLQQMAQDCLRFIVGD